jgi:hypothetical protein
LSGAASRSLLPKAEQRAAEGPHGILHDLWNPTFTTMARRMNHPDYWYSAKTALDWLICHYAFEGRHFAWVAPDFDMYDTKSPESSNPHHLYHGLYAAWKKGDAYSSFVSLKRTGLKKALNINCERRLISRSTANELKRRVDTAHLSLFYPMVYRVDLRNVAPARKVKAGSAKFGSQEYRIDDLQENEFELLFAHFRKDKVLYDIILDGHGRGSYVEVYTLYELLDVRARLNP